MSRSSIQGHLTFLLQRQIISDDTATESNMSTFGPLPAESSGSSPAIIMEPIVPDVESTADSSSNGSGLPADTQDEEATALQESPSPHSAMPNELAAAESSTIRIS
ncbi:hypothetical protein R1flu_016975 [Riccia fluitans]|uniref:Uncharacterized protein n=1 Tax=Riccia fluitans TaxID=41844 RepID=A0ABD1YRF8_9MARC